MKAKPCRKSYGSNKASKVFLNSFHVSWPLCFIQMSQQGWEVHVFPHGVPVGGVRVRVRARVRTGSAEPVDPGKMDASSAALCLPIPLPISSSPQ